MTDDGYDQLERYIKEMKNKRQIAEIEHTKQKVIICPHCGKEIPIKTR